MTIKQPQTESEHEHSSRLREERLRKLEKIRNLGGEISENVSKETNYVIVGENPGSKFKKAQKIGIPTLGEEELKVLLFQR